MADKPKINTAVKNITLAAMFMAIGIVLPIFTGHIKAIGKMLLPMHFPVFLCGLICGWQYGAVIGFILPLLRSVMFGMPPLYPSAMAMSVELLTYGLVSGLMYGHVRRQNIATLYLSLVTAMVAGRAVWGAAEIILLGVKGNTFTWSAFLSGAVLDAVPGIVMQLILIPAIMAVLNKIGLVKFRGEKKAAAAGE